MCIANSAMSTYFPDRLLVLRRGSYASEAALRHQVLAFIAHYNRALAKPIKWTYTGRVTPPEQATAPTSLMQAQAA